jgi:hypothetical protein
MLGGRCSFKGNQSGNADLRLLNEAEGGHGENVLDLHVDALRVIVTAPDDQNGLGSRLLKQSHWSGGSFGVLFAPIRVIQPSVQSGME